MRLTILLLAGALAGCSQSEPAPRSAPDADAATAAQARPPAPAVPVLTAEGWGPLRIGMTGDEVTQAMGGDSDPASAAGAEPEACDLWRPARAPEGLLVMIEQGRLTSIWLVDRASVATDRGLRVGARPDEVRRAYGSAIQASRHEYEDPPAEYLAVWARGGPRPGTDYVDDASARGILYEVDGNGRVRRISAGGPSIQYVEGCS